MVAEKKIGVKEANKGSSKASRTDLTRLGIALFGGILVLNSYLSKFFFNDAIGDVARDLSAFIGALMLGIPIFWEAARNLCHGRVRMNELVALALIAAFAQQDYRTAGAVAFFMLITVTIEKRTAIGAEAAIEAVVRLTPRTARLLRNGQEKEIDAFNDLQPGDICRVRPGENFPADGVILSGISSVNQASITGESLPVDKNISDEVFAGTQNLTGLIEFKVSRVGTDTTLGKVRSLIADAGQSKLPIMRVLDKYIGYYTPVILMIAALAWFITQDIDRVIAVLVMAVPAALVIAYPSAVIAAISAAARLGILIKDVSHIELAARIKAVIFDKTGTLTEGKLEVARLQPVDGVELADLLQVAINVEHHSNHPTAEALKKLAVKAGVAHEPVDSYEEVPGRGVRASLNGEFCMVGRAVWIAEAGISTDALQASLDASEDEGMSIVCVARGANVMGWIGLRDAIRAASQETVAQLRELGVERCCMVTGDNERVAHAVAAKLGITKSVPGVCRRRKSKLCVSSKHRACW